jgi:hypothetical protein
MLNFLRFHCSVNFFGSLFLALRYSIRGPLMEIYFGRMGCLRCIYFRGTLRYRYCVLCFTSRARNDARGLRASHRHAKDYEIATQDKGRRATTCMAAVHSSTRRAAELGDLFRTRWRAGDRYGLTGMYWYIHKSKYARSYMHQHDPSTTITHTPSLQSNPKIRIPKRREKGRRK